MTCPKYSDELVAAAAISEAPSAHLASHLATCADCSRRLEDLARQAHALSELERAPAPRELEGRVVAALHAGHRQERSVAWLAGLGRQLPPQQLEHALAAEAVDEKGGPKAPPELEGRVAADWAGEAAEFATRRALARLPRRSAPKILAERVDDRIRQLRPGQRTASWATRHWEARGRLVAVMTAAALLLTIALQSQSGAPFGFFPASPPPASSPAAESVTAYSFEVRYHDNFRELDATSRAWVDGITGGLTWARER